MKKAKLKFLRHYENRRLENLTGAGVVDGNMSRGTERVNYIMKQYDGKTE